MLGHFQPASYKMLRIQSKEGARTSRTFVKSHNFMKALDGFSWRVISTHTNLAQHTNLHLRFISVRRGWPWRQTHLHLLKDADSSNFCPSSKSDWPEKREKTWRKLSETWHKLHPNCEYPETLLFVFLHLHPLASTCKFCISSKSWKMTCHWPSRAAAFAAAPKVTAEISLDWHCISCKSKLRKPVTRSWIASLSFTVTVWKTSSQVKHTKE